MRENQKTKILCDGEGCSKKSECLRYSLNRKNFRLKSTNCLRLEFDLFISKDEVKEDG
jgi:hypothetical protein